MVALAGALLIGCAVGPDYRPPAPPDTRTYTATTLPAETVSSSGPAGQAQHFEMGDKIPGQWWLLFRSEPLDRLISLALAHSPTVDAAQAALRQARENYRAQYGSTWFPAVDANLSASRQRTTGASFGQAGIGDYIFT